MMEGVDDDAQPASADPAPAIRRLGLVIHPTRRLERVLAEITTWTDAHGVSVGQVPVFAGQERKVAEPVEAGDCDLIVAVGGDGTALAALHAAAGSGPPVLGVACGSVGALMPVAAGRVGRALDQVAAGRWRPVAVPGLEIGWGDGQRAVAVNDLVVIRDGPWQVMVSISVDGVLYARVAGDGLIVATPLGSTAYTLAAGGPILAPGAEGVVLTPLAPHGGSCPPLVVGTSARLSLTVEAGQGVRHEIDGRRTDVEGRLLSVAWRAHHVTLVGLAEQEPRLSGLRRRGLVHDSPRVLVRDARWPEDDPDRP